MQIRMSKPTKPETILTISIMEEDLGFMDLLRKRRKTRKVFAMIALELGDTTKSRHVPVDHRKANIHKPNSQMASKCRCMKHPTENQSFK